MRNPMSGTNLTAVKVKVSCKSKSINVGNRSAATTCEIVSAFSDATLPQPYSPRVKASISPEAATDQKALQQNEKSLNEPYIFSL